MHVVTDNVLSVFQTEQVEEEEEESTDDEASDKDEDEDAKVEEDEDEKKKKTVDKTVWDWVLINENKPLWTKKSVNTTCRYSHLCS